MKKKVAAILALSMILSSCGGCGCGGCGFGCAEASREMAPMTPEEVLSSTDNWQGESSSKGEGYVSNAEELDDPNYGDLWSSSEEKDSSGQEEVRQPTEGLAYDLIRGGTQYAVTGLGEATDTDIVIPATYEGLPVTMIAENAFRSSSQLTSVVIGDSVTEIAPYAFAACSKLISVVIPDSVTSIGENAFNGDSQIESFSIGSGISFIGDSAFPTYHSFQYNKIGSLLYLGNEDNPYACLFDVENPADLTEATIDSNCRMIAEKAFSGCKKLTEISLPDSVAVIGNNAFENCNNLTNVTVGNGLVYVGSSLFKNANNVQYNEVDDVKYIGNSSNPYCVAVSGTSNTITDINIASGCQVIASAAFINYKQAKTATIPEGVVTIGKNAFNNCQSLTTVSFPNSLITIGENAFVYAVIREVNLTGQIKTIGKWAFSNCYYIENVTIGANVETIGYVAFAGCKFLESFIYQGTVDSWNKIYMTTLFDSKVTLGEISCLDGTVSL